MKRGKNYSQIKRLKAKQTSEFEIYELTPLSRRVYYLLNLS